MATKWKEEELILVKEHYLKPDGFDILKRLLPHRGYNSIKSRANGMGLTRKIYYTKNDYFFSHPNDINCMVAGFIAADGYINIPKQRFYLILCQKDEDHLKKIKELTGYTGPIYTRQPKLKTVILKANGKSYVVGKNKIVTLLIACADRWILDLDRNWNITTRKTFTLKPPPLTDLRHILCFLSGFIDGDGWVCLNDIKCKGYTRTLEISVMGTKEMMGWVRDIFKFLTPDWKADIQKDTSPNIYIFKTTGLRAYLLAKLFLSLDIPRLDRKWDNAREYIRDIEEHNLMGTKFRNKLAKVNFDWSLIERLKTEIVSYNVTSVAV